MKKANLHVFSLYIFLVVYFICNVLIEESFSVSKNTQKQLLNSDISNSSSSKNENENENESENEEDPYQDHKSPELSTIFKKQTHRYTKKNTRNKNFFNKNTTDISITYKEKEPVRVIEKGENRYFIDIEKNYSSILIKFLEEEVENQKIFLEKELYEKKSDQQKLMYLMKHILIFGEFKENNKEYEQLSKSISLLQDKFEILSKSKIDTLEQTEKSIKSLGLKYGYIGIEDVSVIQETKETFKEFKKQLLKISSDYKIWLKKNLTSTLLNPKNPSDQIIRMELSLISPDKTFETEFKKDNILLRRVTNTFPMEIDIKSNQELLDLVPYGLLIAKIDLSKLDSFEKKYVSENIESYMGEKTIYKNLIDNTYLKSFVDKMYTPEEEISNLNSSMHGSNTELYQFGKIKEPMEFSLTTRGIKEIDKIFLKKYGEDYYVHVIINYRSKEIDTLAAIVSDAILNDRPIIGKSGFTLIKDSIESKNSFVPTKQMDLITDAWEFTYHACPSMEEETNFEGVLQCINEAGLGKLEFPFNIFFFQEEDNDDDDNNQFCVTSIYNLGLKFVSWAKSKGIRYQGSFFDSAEKLRTINSYILARSFVSRSFKEIIEFNSYYNGDVPVFFSSKNAFYFGLKEMSVEPDGHIWIW